MQFLQVKCCLTWCKVFSCLSTNSSAYRPFLTLRAPKFPLLVKDKWTDSCSLHRENYMQWNTDGKFAAKFGGNILHPEEKSIHRFCSSLTLSLLNQTVKNTFGDRWDSVEQNFGKMYPQTYHNVKQVALKPASIFRSAFVCKSVWFFFFY